MTTGHAGATKGLSEHRRLLVPLSIDEQNDEVGPQPSEDPARCSDKGFLEMTVVDYLELLDWTARLTETMS